MMRNLSLIGLALALSACGTSNRGLESIHQPIVQRTDYMIDVATTGAGLAAGEQDRLEGWFRSIGLSFGDRVAIDGPAGATGGEVAELLARRGMTLAGAVPITAGQVPNDSVRVVVSRSTASVPGCPDWSRPSTPEFTGSTMSNYGCANNAALAAMVADPMDLVQGREGAPVDPAVATRAIGAYRAAPPTGSNNTIKAERTSRVGN